MHLSVSLSFCPPTSTFLSNYLLVYGAGGGDNIWKHTNIILLCIIISKFSIIIYVYRLDGWSVVSNWLILKCQIYCDIK